MGDTAFLFIVIVPLGLLGVAMLMLVDNDRNRRG